MSYKVQTIFFRETVRRVSETPADHSREDKDFHLFKRTVNNKTVVDSGYHDSEFQRKIAGALYMEP